MLETVQRDLGSEKIVRDGARLYGGFVSKIDERSISRNNKPARDLSYWSIG